MIEWLPNRLRKTSGSRDFPWSDPRVPVIRIDEDGMARRATKPNEKLSLLHVTESEHPLLLAVWPGQFRSDVFVIDNPGQGRQILLGRREDASETP